MSVDQVQKFEADNDVSVSIYMWSDEDGCVPSTRIRQQAGRETRERAAGPGSQGFAAVPFRVYPQSLPLDFWTTAANMDIAVCSFVIGKQIRIMIN